jgi:HEAT repeat protein
LLLVSSAPVACAQSDPVTKLYEQLEEGGAGGRLAAFELFRRGDQDERLLAIVRNTDGASKKGWRVSILAGLEFAAASRGAGGPEAACRLALAALDDVDPEVARLGVEAFASLDRLPTYTFLSKELGVRRYATGESGEGRVARGLIDALGLMRNPQRAAEVLAAALEERLGPALEPHVTDVLERITARRFASPREWFDWTESVKGLTLAEWRRDQSQHRAERNRRYEQECEAMFKRLLVALRDSPDRLLAELERGLTGSVPSVRRRAVVELGRLGRLDDRLADRPEKEAGRARAIGLLSSQLPAPGEASPHYSELQALVILHLGKTEDPGLVEKIARFLSVTSPRMRAAAANALGELGAPAGTGPLLVQLRAQHGVQSDGELTQAVISAIGRIGHNGGPLAEEDEAVSSALVTFCRKALLAGDASAPLSLTRAAEALGKLPYPRKDDLGPVAGLLVELAVHPDPKVRFAAVTSLGPLEEMRVFPLLEARLKDESENYIRKAILDAIGLQALADTAQVIRAVDLLVPFLFADEALRPRSVDALKRITKGHSFEALEHLVVALRKERDAKVALQVAGPFLRQLPAPDALTDDMKPHRDRYFKLLATRGWSSLVKAPAEALLDFEAVLDGREWKTVTPESVSIYLGKARAKLALELPGEAFGIACACLAEGAAPDHRVEAWTVALDAIALGKRVRPKAIPAMLAQLEPFAAGIPEELKERLEALGSTK